MTAWGRSLNAHTGHSPARIWMQWRGNTVRNSVGVMMNVALKREYTAVLLTANTATRQTRWHKPFVWWRIKLSTLNASFMQRARSRCVVETLKPTRFLSQQTCCSQPKWRPLKTDLLILEILVIAYCRAQDRADGCLCARWVRGQRVCCLKVKVNTEQRAAISCSSGGVSPVYL